MPDISPTVEGFRLAFRRPALSLAEVVWRWSVGATAAALFLFGLFEYFNTLPVTDGEILLLRTKQPILVAQAIAQLLHGSGSRVLTAALLALLAIALFWMVAASLGRMAIVPCLLDYFHAQIDSASIGSLAKHETSAAGKVSTPAFRYLFRLNFLRVVVAVAGFSGFVGAGILASFTSSTADPIPGLAFLVFLSFAAFVCLAWWFLNWFLSLAALFVVRDCEDALGAVSAAVSLCRERTEAVFAVSLWTALSHLVVFVAATSLVFLPLGLSGMLPGQILALALVLITLVYFAMVDWVSMARLAGYACIAELPDAPSVPVPPSVAPTTPAGSVAPLAAFKGGIDRDELIMSDIPNLAREPGV